LRNWWGDRFKRKLMGARTRENSCHPGICDSFSKSLEEFKRKSVGVERIAQASCRSAR
jgi:hypothetical protein